MQLIAYSLLYDQYFDLSTVILNGIGSKLGSKESRVKKNYFARFIMIVINHLVKEVVLDRADDQLHCWTQSKRVFMDLVRINRQSGIGLSYPPFVHVFISSLSSSQTLTTLPSAIMEGKIQHLPSQAAKPSKTKSKQSTSSVSQNTGVVKITKSKNVGTLKVVSKGEWTRDNQQM